MIVIDKNLIVELDGSGNIIEIEDLVGIGSGGIIAESSARALITHTNLSAEQIALESMKIASEKCVFTNKNFI